ncbi:MAG: hypothetical protein WKF32_03630 [Thermoleophilaceae bacterium]
MLTAIVSDLHLGTASGADVARRPDVCERLCAAVSEADRVVVLGDLLEMRERRAADVLEAAGPALSALGDATRGKQLVIVPGNHDHELIGPALDRARLAGEGPLPTEATFGAGDGELSRRVAALMPETEVVLAYPGIRLRDDVWATHGHYLDLHLTVPRVECVISSAIAKFAASVDEDAAGTPDFYEAALSPLYAFAYSLVQGSEGRVVTRGGNLSRSVWSATNPGSHRRRSPRGMALSLAIPAAVAALNASGLGPFRGDLSAVELRRAGLRAMATVVRSLGVPADHVIFGHTHRAGPLPGEAEGWFLPGGTQLTNTGSWLQEEVFIRGGGPSNPYWPGRVTWLEDQGPPRLTGVLDDLDVTELSSSGRTP